MRIRVGFEITYDFVARTPMMLMLNVHPSRAADVIKPDQLRVSPAVPFDARHNIPRIGRIVMARGRDAADVAFSTTFGPNVLKRFVVHTDEVVAAEMELLERKVA